MQIFYQATNVLLGWDEELDCAYIKWQGFAYGEELRSQMEKVLQLLKEKGGSKELVNLQKNRITSKEDQEWIVSNWLPRAIAAGLKHVAFVIPESELAKASLNAMAQMRNVNTAEAYFQTEEEARQWLRSVE